MNVLATYVTILASSSQQSHHRLLFRVRQIKLTDGLTFISVYFF